MMDVFTQMISGKFSHIHHISALMIIIIIVSQDLEPDNILKIFLNFTNFGPHYSYKIYSFKNMSV